MCKGSLPQPWRQRDWFCPPQTSVLLHRAPQSQPWGSQRRCDPVQARINPIRAKPQHRRANFDPQISSSLLRHPLGVCLVSPHNGRRERREGGAQTISPIPETACDCRQCGWRFLDQDLPKNELDRRAIEAPVSGAATWDRCGDHTPQATLRFARRYQQCCVGGRPLQAIRQPKEHL